MSDKNEANELFEKIKLMPKNEIIIFIDIMKKTNLVFNIGGVLLLFILLYKPNIFTMLAIPCAVYFIAQMSTATKCSIEFARSCLSESK